MDDVARYYEADPYQEDPVAERPVLFGGEMVRAIREGRKWQTRRVVMAPKEAVAYGRSPAWDLAWVDQSSRRGDVRCDYLHLPYGGGDYEDRDEVATRVFPRFAPGDHLWVREGWRTTRSLDGVKPSMLVPGAPVEYLADQWQPRFGMIDKGKGRPSIFMPRWASRILLQVTQVRVERLQAISETDAVAEGVAPNCIFDRQSEACPCCEGGECRVPDEWIDYSVPEDSDGSPPCLSARESFRTLWESINADHGYSWESNPWLWVVDFKVLKGGVK